MSKKRMIFIAAGGLCIAMIAILHYFMRQDPKSSKIIAPEESEITAPPESEIEEMTASLNDEKDNWGIPSIPKCRIPRLYRAALLHAFFPARTCEGIGDDVLGNVVITTGKG